MATTPAAKPAASAADLEAAAKAEADALAAQAEASAKAAVAADAPKVEADAKAEETGLIADLEKDWVAVKTFTARHLSQLLHFDKGDAVPSNVAVPLASKGAPVRPVE